MIGPLSVTMVHNIWVTILDDSGRSICRICAWLHSDAEANAYALVEAFNQAPMLRAELAAVKAENARLREMIQKYGIGRGQNDATGTV